MPLGIGFEREPRLGKSAFLADAGEHVLQRAPVRRVIEHRIGGDQGDASARGELGERGDAGPVVAAIGMTRREIEVSERTKCLLDESQLIFEISFVMPAKAGIQ